MGSDRIKIQVFRRRSAPRTVSVFTDLKHGGGTRIYGPKMLPGDGELVAEFWLDAEAIEEIESDLMDQRAAGGEAQA